MKSKKPIGKKAHAPKGRSRDKAEEIRERNAAIALDNHVQAHVRRVGSAQWREEEEEFQNRRRARGSSMAARDVAQQATQLRWPSASSRRHAPARRSTSPGRWWPWTVPMTWASSATPAWTQTWWSAWPRTASSAAPPGPYSGRGRPHKYGPVFKLPDVRTHGRPDRPAGSPCPVFPPGVFSCRNA